MLGDKCRKFMADKKMADSKIKSICQHARTFYETAASYIYNKLPLRNELLKHAEVFDLSMLSTKSFTSVEYFLNRFEVLSRQCPMDEVQEEFHELQIEALQESLLSESDAGTQWGLVGQIKGTSGKPKFPTIARLAQYVLLIPHSNASCERVFSHVRKIRSEFRPTMGTDTLSAICVMKENLGGVCYDGNFSKEETQKAKKATTTFLNN